MDIHLKNVQNLQLLQLCFDIAQQDNMPQIVATTHNPYIVDQFKYNEHCIIIVEKFNGATTFTSFENKAKSMKIEDEDPLGELWFSGSIGGTPEYGAKH